MLRGVIAFVIVLTAACIAESLTMPTDDIPPVITLVQEEPVYHENTEHVGTENEVNVEKFSNPVLCGGDVPPYSTTTESHTAASSYVPTAEGRLTKSKGVFNGPSGKESYYNLPMGRCIEIMRGLGFSEEEYPYWIRDDGAKMLGDYVMCAANLELRPKGTIVESSLGISIVVDTGPFAKKNPTQLDLCVNW